MSSEKNDTVRRSNRLQKKKRKQRNVECSETRKRQKKRDFNKDADYQILRSALREERVMEKQMAEEDRRVAQLQRRIETSIRSLERAVYDDFTGAQIDIKEEGTKKVVRKFVRLQSQAPLENFESFKQFLAVHVPGFATRWKSIQLAQAKSLNAIYRHNTRMVSIDSQHAFSVAITRKRAPSVDAILTVANTRGTIPIRVELQRRGTSAAALTLTQMQRAQTSGE